MKILFVTDLYPVELSEKHTPKTLFNFVKCWKKEGVEVSVIKPNFILNSFLRRKPFYKTGRYGDVFNVNYWTPFWFNVKDKLPQKLDYDIVVAHMPSGILFAKKLGLPFVASVHNSDLEILTNPVYSFYFKKRLKAALYKAKAVFCRSFVIQKRLLEIMPELKVKTYTAPSGVDEKLIIRREPLQDKKNIKVLTCAKLIKRKNIDKVIEAVKGLENFSLTVIGEGPEEKYLKSLDKNVTFTGHLPQHEVYEKMRQSDIFVLPSVGETFGMVYLEAMASGCIVVGTKDDGIDGIIKDGENGFLTFPISDEIRKNLLKIKNMGDDRLKALSYNSFSTVSAYTENRKSNEYLQRIFKIL